MRLLISWGFALAFYSSASYSQNLCSHLWAFFFALSASDYTAFLSRKKRFVGLFCVSNCCVCEPFVKLNSIPLDQMRHFVFRKSQKVGENFILWDLPII